MTYASAIKCRRSHKGRMVRSLQRRTHALTHSHLVFVSQLSTSSVRDGRTGDAASENSRRRPWSAKVAAAAAPLRRPVAGLGGGGGPGLLRAAGGGQGRHHPPNPTSLQETGSHHAPRQEPREIHAALPHQTNHTKKCCLNNVPQLSSKYLVDIMLPQDGGQAL